MRKPCPRCGGEYWYENGRQIAECRNPECNLSRGAIEPGGQPYYMGVPFDASFWDTLCPDGCLMIFAWEAV